MDEHDMILPLAICDLLEKSVTPEAVEKSFEKAKKRLERLRNPRPPREAILSHAHRRDEIE
jgi:hypothetical protein